MTFRALSRNLLAVLFAISGEAQIEIRGSRLYVDQEWFPVRGVAYSPTPIGAAPGPGLQVPPCLYWRDLPLMARSGANTVRVFGRIAAGDAAFWEALQASGLYLLAGFPLEPYFDPGASLAPGSRLRERILGDFRSYLSQLKAPQRVLAVLIGPLITTHDYKNSFAGSLQDFYSLVDEAAVAARPTLVSTTLPDASDLGVVVRDSDAPNVPFWALEGRFTGLRGRTGKPVLMSGLAVSAWDAERQAEDAEAQSVGLRGVLRQLKSEPVLGGVVFEWTDEWWRGDPDPARHGPGEGGWFGLFGLAATDAPGLDGLRPRPAFTVLAANWGGTPPEEWPARRPRLRAQGVVNAGSLAPVAAPGALISVFGEDLADGQRDLTSVCVASRPAPLLVADAGQINGLLPWETPAGTAAALVYKAGLASNVVTVEVRDAAPGIFERGVLPAGKPCPATLVNGVRPGTYLEVYGTGLGRPGTPLRAFVGSRETPVLFSGLVPGIAGLSQTNIQVPPDFPSGSAARLMLLAGGTESNAYPFQVVSGADRPRLTLGPSELSFLVQAGGPPGSAELALDGEGGFCEVVRFRVAGLPQGVEVSAPVGFPGQPVPVTVQAREQARGNSDIPVEIAAVTTLAENPVTRLRITVLPSRGDIPFRVVSGGGRAGLVARFEMAGRLLYQAAGGGPGRGFNFLTLNGDTGVLGGTRCFDTWFSERAATEMADYLTGLPPGTVVLGAIADEGTFHLTERARAALREVLRAQWADSLGYQDSWAILARVGAALPIAEGVSHDQPVVIERVLTF